jgi:hypothetical protein
MFPRVITLGSFLRTQVLYVAACSDWNRTHETVPEVREHGSHTAQEASFEVFLSSSSISNNILPTKSLTLYLLNGLETRESEVGGKYIVAHMKTGVDQ